MIKNSNINKNINKYLLGGFALSVVLVLFFLIIGYENPIHWLIDAVPVLTAALLYYKTKEYQSEKEELLGHLDQKDLTIDRNAKFAKQIGEGDFESEFTITDENDILGKSLLIMRENLIANTKKEADQSWIAQGKDIISDILRISVLFNGNPI